jgi:hypothetical protein
MDVLLVVEDILQEVMLRKLLHAYRSDLCIVSVSGRCGNAYIKTNLSTFNKVSESLPHIVLTDLDRKPCAPQLLREWVNFRWHKNMLLRIAEKEIDAWILSDRYAFAKFIGVSSNQIPLNTQEIADPKQYIINLARKSRKKVMKDIIPHGTVSQGPGYNILLQIFIQHYWDAEKARLCNASLDRAIKRLKTFLSI